MDQAQTGSVTLEMEPLLGFGCDGVPDQKPAEQGREITELGRQDQEGLGTRLKRCFQRAELKNVLGELTNIEQYFWSDVQQGQLAGE